MPGRESGLTRSGEPVKRKTTMTPEPTDKLDAATQVVVNGPEGELLDWRQIDWRRVEDQVRGCVSGSPRRQGRGPPKGPPTVAGWRDRSLELGRDCRPLAAGGCQPCHADGRGDRRGHVGEDGRCRLGPDDDQQLPAVAEIGVDAVAERLLRLLPADSQGRAAAGQLQMGDLCRPRRPGRPERRDGDGRAREPVSARRSPRSGDGRRVRSAA